MWLTDPWAPACSAAVTRWRTHRISGRRRDMTEWRPGRTEMAQDPTECNEDLTEWRSDRAEPT